MLLKEEFASNMSYLEPSINSMIVAGEGKFHSKIVLLYGKLYIFTCKKLSLLYAFSKTVTCLFVSFLMYRK